MIGSLLVYGGQQWRGDGLHKASWGELQFLYHCVALVKNAESDAAKEAQEKAAAQAAYERERDARR